MKKLILDSPVYKKFFELCDIISEKLQSDIGLLTMNVNIEKLINLIYENNGGGMQENEIFGRIMHYIILDNINMIHQYLDTSSEVKYLKNTFIGIFHIQEKSKKYIKLFNITTGKIHIIIGEGMGSERSLMNFDKGDILISRIIQMEDGLYNMKKFYFVHKKDYSKETFETLKIIYTQLLSGVKDMLDMEERMNKLVKM